MRLIAILGAVAVGHGAAAAEPARIGFVNAGSASSGAFNVIQNLRMGVTHEGLLPIADSSVRDALEAPLQPASSQGIDTAKSELDAAQDAYASFEYAGALSHLIRADDILRGLPTDDAVLELSADRYLLAGLVFTGRGADAQAVEAFRIVRRLRPQRRELDPGVYRPQIVRLYRSAGSTQLATVGLQVTTKPAGATVWIDGNQVGKSPVNDASVSVGLHRIAVSRPGYANEVRMVQVDARAEVEVELRPLEAADEILAIRRDLGTRAPGDPLWMRSAARLAALAGAELLVLVRSGASGAFEAAIYDGRELGSWIPVPSSRFYALLSPTTAGNTSRRGVGTTIPPAGDRPEESDAAWYRHWWGKGLIAAGVIAVASTAIYFGTASDGITIGGWCSGAGCSQ